MQLPIVLTRWLDTLAGLVVAWQDVSRARKSIIVTRQDTDFVLRRSNATHGEIIAKIAAGTKMPAAIAQALRNHFVIFEIAPSQIIPRQLTVPAQAREFLSGIVRNQLERLSPWPLAQIFYGVDAKPGSNDAGTLNVTVLIAARATLETLCDELTASGLPPNRIVARKEDGGKGTLITLWTRPAERAKGQAWSPQSMIGAGLAAILLLAAGISLWALYSANAISTESADVVAQTQSLQRQGQSSRKLDMTGLNPPQRAWAMKENTPVTVLILEFLARALPDSAYLTEIHLENTTLRINGLATDAPSLVGALERSGRFSEVHFFAPTTKDQGSALFRFYIEARVDNHPQPIGD
ncbi:PilN domain-containing protein [Methyloferula stellata]|uniref:PilN domain-containing protein n=1 Tax=Methyloferula stellata TaxID=876270 RepID=UPI00035DFA5A|nr:PilN domain-containing protein [Methyloferula stellata]